MASRVIYDSFLTSKSVARLKPYYQDQFHRWLHLPDDWGCFNADPDVIKGICYPKRPETTKKIIQIRRALCRNGDLFVWKTSNGREWAYFVTFGLHNKFCTASTVDERGKYTKHRRKTPEPPPKLVKLYIARIPTSSDILRQVATKSSYPIPDPIPIPKKIFVEDSTEFRLASLLLQKIRERKPDYKEPNLQSWAKDIDLMLRIDKRKPEIIEKVILWCQADDFWQNNILSTRKLRKQFDRLELQKPKKYRDSPPAEVKVAEVPVERQDISEAQRKENVRKAKKLVEGLSEKVGNTKGEK